MPFINDTNIDPFAIEIYLFIRKWFFLFINFVKNTNVTKIKSYKRCLHLDEMCQSFSKLIQA